MQKMKFLDLFAGIGGFRIGMESAGHECIGFCEIDKFARASYKAIHDTKGEIELHDITTVSDDTIRGIGKQIANTLLTGESQGVVEPDFRIRKLTPRECWRLQGFPDWAFDKAQEVNSNSQLYKQAGNSVTVNVISAIAQGLGGN
ncbi:DNA methylase [Streptococcus pneumoniae]|nr:DNA methylase [Streptococcus pneumoniae]VIW43733.1 DNA methylase [Streptococcus pneumoniae]VIW57861.1 DNA methylase [Streptococcus pneumoniae]VKB85137.1 DNA methylase [Streptococcus pneumoniae]VKJ51411.1 DNA methylase [Streptococcus pneumoniae]